MLTLVLSFTYFSVSTPMYALTTLLLIHDFNNYSVMSYIRKLPNVNNADFRSDGC